MPSLKSLNLSIAVLAYNVFAAHTLLYAVTLTFDLEHLQCIAYYVMIELGTKFTLFCGGFSLQFSSYIL